MLRRLGIESARRSIGEAIGVSEWTVVTRATLAPSAQLSSVLYLDSTLREQTPFGETVLPGLLLLALGQRWSRELYTFDDCGVCVDYGFDRVRYFESVTEGSVLRLHSRLQSTRDIPSGLEVVVSETIEVGGKRLDPAEPPGRACKAERVIRMYTAHAPGVF